MSEWWLMQWGVSWLPPEARTVWGWPIATAYVFAGTSGMIMFLGAYESWRRRAGPLWRVGMFAGVAGIAVAAAIFVVDLGVPWRFLNLIIAVPTRLVSSPMTWGVLVMSVLPLLGLYAVKRGSESRALAPWVMVFGLLLALYPGFLLAATSIALWNTYLPVLFLATSLSAGAAFMALAAGLVIKGLEERRSAVRRMETIAVVSTAAELVLLAMFLYAAGQDGRALPALRALVGSPVGIYFWAGAALTVVAGIGLLPTVLPANRERHAGPVSLAGAFAVAAGGSFLLRASLFLAGFAAFGAVSPFGAYTIQLP
jgi:formate-dependent nitrite reductase membrane component NrfD